MGEIKFRVWSTINKPKMISWMVLFGSSSDFLRETFEWKVMQYTGLKDKNGKEIYEGDVVKYEDSYGLLTRLIYNVGCAFAIKTPENPIFLHEFFDGYEYDGKPARGIEIMGNIYENPELLNKEI